MYVDERVAVTTLTAIRTPRHGLEEAAAWRGRDWNHPPSVVAAAASGTEGWRVEPLTTHAAEKRGEGRDEQQRLPADCVRKPPQLTAAGVGPRVRRGPRIRRGPWSRNLWCESLGRQGDSALAP